MLTLSAIPPSRGPELPQQREAGGSDPPTGTVSDGPTAGWPNPDLRLDPALGIVVMEFRDRSGAIAATLPTERELAAYRHAASRGEPTPAAEAPEPMPAVTPADGLTPLPAAG